MQWFKLNSKQAYGLGLEPNFPKIVNLGFKLGEVNDLNIRFVSEHWSWN